LGEAQKGKIMPQSALTMSRAFAFAALVLMEAFFLGCNSAPSVTGQKSAVETASSVTAASVSAGSDNPGINLQCAANRVRKAPAPFHWSFKKVVTAHTNADWEADVTTDSIAGTLIDSSGTRTIQGIRPDMTCWNTAVLVLTGPMPASTFALVDNSSATVRVGTEAMNGENAIRYAIDTSLESTADASLIKSVLGGSGFIKGSAWVTTDGCPVKFVLDLQQSLRDESVQKEHYEESLTKR
jgi:hypothetical protein